MENYNTGSAMQPLQNRIEFLDILRGFALFGVLTVNMLDFSGPVLKEGTLGARGDTLDRFFDLSIGFFAVTKFYLIFSFLFGVGFSVQMQRRIEQGAPLVGFYLLRMFWLFLFGLAHYIFVWEGDILTLYAMAGVVLLFLRKLSTKILLVISGVIWLVGWIYFSFIPVQSAVTLAAPGDITIFINGSYGDLIERRESLQSIFDIQIPMVIVMFLLGLATGKSGLVHNPERILNLTKLKVTLILLLALIGNIMLVHGYQNDIPARLSFGIHCGAPAMAFLYIWMVYHARRFLRRLAAVGRTALTSYLFQSIICTTIFYGYGLGAYGKMHPTATFLLTIAIFSAQLLIANLWLKFFRFGPFELIWRALSYGPSGFRKNQSA